MSAGALAHIVALEFIDDEWCQVGFGDSGLSLQDVC
jgi:hypothetical protein